jgi:ESS family glutamate:Na+ symporter
MEPAVSALVAGPITNWLVERPGLRPATASQAPGAPAGRTGAEDGPDPTSVILQTTLLLAIAVATGERLNRWVREADVVMPGFPTTMIGGVLIANIADALGRRLPLRPIERGGEYALQVFLVLSFMSLQLWTVAAAIGPLLLNVLIQGALTTALATFVLFPLMRRDYEAAVTCGGFLGFALSSMPVAMATMDHVTSRRGPAPRAFLLITLAGSFFVDLANALVTKAFLALPLFAG